MNTINSRNLHEVVRLRILLLFAVRFLNQEAGDWAYGSAGRPSLSLEARGYALSCIGDFLGMHDKASGGRQLALPDAPALNWLFLPPRSGGSARGPAYRVIGWRTWKTRLAGGFLAVMSLPPAPMQPINRSIATRA